MHLGGNRGWNEEVGCCFPPHEIAEEEAARADAYGVNMISFRNYACGWRWYSLLLYPGTMLYVSFLDIPSFLSTYFPVA